jgi:hypothetical protein
MSHFPATTVADMFDIVTLHVGMIADFNHGFARAAIAIER